MIDHTSSDGDRAAATDEHPGRHRPESGAGTGGGVEVVRSAEHAVTSTRRVPVERVRLEKTVVEEEQVVTVRVRREQVRVVREPVVDGGGAAAAERAATTPWVTVTEERPQVTVVPVPVERVRIVVDAVRSTEEREIELAHEEIDLRVDQR